MAISVLCSCGKRLGLSDALAGRTIKCPACGEPLLVTGSTQSAAKAPTKKQSASPAIYISTGKIVALVSVAMVVGLGMMFYFGPMRVWNQWENIGGQARSDVSDVIAFGLQAYLSQNGMFDPNDIHGAPSVDENVNFFRPTLAMSMPEKVLFFGKSSQGDFKGYYHPSSGDIEADVNYGGKTFAGAVNLARATGQFHMTGRMVKGFPQAEVNGTPINIVWPEKKKEE